MSRGMAIWSLICMALCGFICVSTMIQLLADGEIMAALFAPVLMFWIYYLVVHAGALFANVLGVADDVLQVNLKESRRIRGKE